LVGFCGDHSATLVAIRTGFGFRLATGPVGDYREC
jgi:hypothetical protein